MNYTEVINAIKNASLFDLYRLSVAIKNEMENPDRINQLRLIVKEGDIVSYFDAKSNTLQQAKVLQKNLKYVLVENTNDSRRWKIQYFLLNLANVAIDIVANNSNKLSKNNLKVGDFVGFNKKDGKAIIGVIIRLNHNTVTLVSKDNQRWRVSYSLLHRIIDVDIVDQFDSKQIAIWIKENGASELEDIERVPRQGQTRN